MRQRLVWIVLPLLVSGCLSAGDTAPALTGYDIVRPQMPALEQVIWDRPELRGARADFLAAASRIDDSELNFAPSVSGSAQAGVTDDGDTSAQAAGVLSLNYSQVLNDFGRSDIQRDQAETELEAKQVAYALVADDLYITLARAQIERVAAAEKIGVIDRQLARFREREAQIQQAAALGVMTNADLLEIRSAENQIAQTLSLARSQRDVAQSVITQTLGHSDAAASQVGRAVARLMQVDLSRLPQWRRARAELLLDQSDKTVQAILASTRPRTSLQGQVTRPLDPNEPAELFVGVRWDFSIYDGGRAAQEAQSQRIASQGLAEQVSAIETNTRTARAQLQVTLRGLRAQRAALRDQITLSQERIDLFEQLLVAGRSDVSKIASEILAQADAELAMIDVTMQSRLAIVGYAQTVGGTCAVFDACSSFHLRWQEVANGSL